MLKRIFLITLLALGPAAWTDDFSAPRKALMSPEMLTCAGQISGLPGQRLLGVVVAGRATGNKLPLVAKALGFKVLHIYPDGISTSITNTFPNVFDFEPIVFGSPSDLPLVANQIRRLAQKNQIEIAGFVAGLDYGVDTADYLNQVFATPGNIPTNWRSNKGLLNDRLGDLGVPVVTSRILALDDVSTGVANLQFPLFIKPASSFASIGAGQCPSPAHLSGVLSKMVADCAKMNLVVGDVVVEDFLHPDTIYFVNTISAKIRGEQKRIVTGVALDSRGDEFPKTVWDLIVLMPPPHLLDEKNRKLFQHVLAANELVLDHSKTTVGSSHLEFMARTATVSSPSDLLPIDLNLRLPGIDFPSLELLATGVDPYVLDLVSHTDPELLENFPPLYSGYNQAVGLIFLRSHWTGTASREGVEWAMSLLNNRNARTDQAHFTQIAIPSADSPVVETTNGSTMQGYFHVAAPTIEALKNLHEEVRKKERAKFFVK